MDCDTFIDLMTEYLEEDLSRENSSLWEKHFQDCEACNKFFKSFRKSLDLIANVRRGECPPEVRERLESLLLEKVQQARGREGY